MTSELYAEQSRPFAASNSDATSEEFPQPRNPPQPEEQNDTKDDPADADQQCAAVLDGGMDDTTPVRIWDAVMKKYKLAQQCDQELARIDSQTDGAKREELLVSGTQKPVANLFKIVKSKPCVDTECYLLIMHLQNISLFRDRMRS